MPFSKAIYWNHKILTELSFWLWIHRNHNTILHWAWRFTGWMLHFIRALLTHKVLCGIAPRYLGPLNRVTDIFARRSLRSSGTSRLVVPPFRLSTVGSRAFPVAAAKIWNALPDSLVSIISPSSFQHHLKTFCSRDPSHSTAVDLAVVLQYFRPL